MRQGGITWTINQTGLLDAAQKHARHKNGDTTQGYNENQTAESLLGVF